MWWSLLVDAQPGEMGRHVINNDITCINCLWLLYVCRSCDLMVLTVQDFIDDYWLFGITKTVRISWSYRNYKPKSIEPVRGSVALDKRHTTDVEPATGMRTWEYLRRRVTFYYQRIKHSLFFTGPRYSINYVTTFCVGSFCKSWYVLLSLTYSWGKKF